MKNFTTYQLKEKFFSVKDTYTVHDEAGELAYQIKGSFFSWDNDLKFEDAAGEEQLIIDQKRISLRPTYVLRKGKETLATVRKKAGLFKQKLEIDLPKGKDYTVKGSFIDKEFSFHKGGKKVAEVSKAWFSISDTYGVRVSSEAEHDLIIATVIIIDLIQQAENKE